MRPAISTAHPWNFRQPHLHVGMYRDKAQIFFLAGSCVFYYMEPALHFLGSNGVLSTEVLSQFIGLSLISSPETVCFPGPWRMRNYWLLRCFSSHWVLKVKGLLDGSEQAKFIQSSKASGSPEPHSVRAHRTAGASSPQHATCPPRLEVFLPHCTADIKQKSHCELPSGWRLHRALKNFLFFPCLPLPQNKIKITDFLLGFLWGLNKILNVGCREGPQRPGLFKIKPHSCPLLWSSIMIGPHSPD